MKTGDPTHSVALVVRGSEAMLTSWNESAEREEQRNCEAPAGQVITGN